MQRRVHRVPISHEAVALIRLRRDAVPKGRPFLFLGDVPGQPVVDLKRFWERMRVQADITDVRIHDLRHTYASMAVSGRTRHGAVWFQSKSQPSLLGAVMATELARSSQAGMLLLTTFSEALSCHYPKSMKMLSIQLETCQINIV